MNNDAQIVANNFINELYTGKFDKEIHNMLYPPQGSGSIWTSETDKRDSKAVTEFLDTDLFQDIMNL